MLYKLIGIVVKISDKTIYVLKLFNIFRYKIYHNKEFVMTDSHPHTEFIYRVLKFRRLGFVNNKMMFTMNTTF